MRGPFRQFVEASLGQGLLLITCGLPGIWKTETSEEISKTKGYPIVRSDLVRREVLKNEDIFDLSIIHLLVDTTQETLEDWYIIGLEKR